MTDVHDEKRGGVVIHGDRFVVSRHHEDVVMRFARDRALRAQRLEVGIRIDDECRVPKEVDRVEVAHRISWWNRPITAFALYESAVFGSKLEGQSSKSEVDEGRHRTRDEHVPADVDDELVDGSEDTVEQHRALHVPMERVLGGEADAREHLLAVARDGARGASRCCLGQRGR